MKVSICRSLATRARKSKACRRVPFGYAPSEGLPCPSSAKQTAGQQAPTESPLGRSLPTRSQKVYHHAARCKEKRNMPRCSLASRPLVLVLMSFCFAFLLTLTIQGAINSPAMAAGSPPPGPNDGYYLYTQGSCSGFANKDVLQVWI